MTLTEQGLGLVDRAVGSGLAVQTEALSALNAEQTDQLVSLLRELLLDAEK